MCVDSVRHNSFSSLIGPFLHSVISIMAVVSVATVIPLRRPDEAEDPLTTVLRSGARQLLAQAIEAEAEALLATLAGVRLPDGRGRLLRRRHGPECQMQSGIGPVAVRRAKLRDRGISGAVGRIRSTGRASVLPSRYGCDQHGAEANQLEHGDDAGEEDQGSERIHVAGGEILDAAEDRAGCTGAELDTGEDGIGVRRPLKHPRRRSPARSARNCPACPHASASRSAGSGARLPPRQGLCHLHDAHDTA